MRWSTLVKPLLALSLTANAGPLLAAAATAPTTTASAATAPATPAQQALTASPVDDIVAQYPAMMSRGIRDGLVQNAQVPEMVADTLGRMISANVKAEDINRRIVDNLDQNLTDAQLDAVKQWYDTPLAGRIAKAEIAASAPAAWPTIQSQAAALNKKYQGTERARLFDRFDRASRATESAVDTAIALQLSLSSALSALRGEPVTPEQTRSTLEAQRPALRGVVGQQVYDTYLYTYQSFSNQELGLYLAFLESDAGSAFMREVTGSIQQAITEPVTELGKQMSRMLTPGLSSGN